MECYRKCYKKLLNGKDKGMGQNTEKLIEKKIDSVKEAMQTI